MADGKKRRTLAARNDCQPALWLFRQVEPVWLRSNGTSRDAFELRPTLGTEAQPRDAVTVPAFQAPEPSTSGARTRALTPPQNTRVHDESLA